MQAMISGNEQVVNHMSDQLTLLRMAAPAPDESGATVRFRIEGKDDRSVDIDCDPDQMENVIGFLIELARDAAERRSAQERNSFSRAETVDVTPNPVSAATFMVDPDSSEIMLLLRMFGFDLGFSLTPEHLAALKRELDRILPALGIKEPSHHHHGHDHHH